MYNCKTYPSLHKRSIMTAVFLSIILVVTMIPAIPFAYAVQPTAPEASYEFDHAKTAVSQLEDLFTTIDIMDATASGLSDEMEKGNVSSEQLVQMYLDRIKAYDNKKKINSVISLNPNALEEARVLDDERKEGKIRGALHGIPVIVKDNYDLAGTATTAGSLALADFMPEKDSFVVDKLKKAGAVVIAKANLSEFAFSSVDSHSLIGGYVHNPYDLSRSPAGSSGGSGAAVTANFAAIGFGTDTGGSIRNPSSWCNIYGIKPSKGLTSIDGVLPLAASRDVTGPMARTAEDMALALETIAGTDQKDDFTVEADADGLLREGYTGDLSADSIKGMKIGYLKHSFAAMRREKDESGEYKEVLKDPDNKVMQMMKRTRADLRKAGATFVDMSDVLDDDNIVEWYTDYEENDPFSFEYDVNKYLNDHGERAPFKTLKELLLSGKDGIDYSYIGDDTEKMADTFEETVNPYDTNVNGFMRTGTWGRTMERRDALAEMMDQKGVDAIMFLEDVNVPSHDVENVTDNYLQYMMAANPGGELYARLFGSIIGCPDLVLPMGFSETDENCRFPMPLGMHFVGRFGDEKTLMQIAYAYEQQAGPDIRRIPECTPALEDKNMNAFLEALMDEVYSIDYSAFGRKPEGKAKLMEKAYDKAAAVDTSDPYAVYKAAHDLARAYDKTVDALKASGVNLAKATVKLSKSKYTYTGKKITPAVKVTVGGVTLVRGVDYSVSYKNNLDAGTAKVVITPADTGNSDSAKNGNVAAAVRYSGSKTVNFKIKKGKTSFTARASKKKIRAAASGTKKVTVRIKVSGLSKGSSKAGFTIKKVTNGQRPKVNVNKKSGKVTTKVNTKKCTIEIRVRSKANKNRKSKTKIIRIKVI